MGSDDVRRIRMRERRWNDGVRRNGMKGCRKMDTQNGTRKNKKIMI